MWVCQSGLLFIGSSPYPSGNAQRAKSRLLNSRAGGPGPSTSGSTVLGMHIAFIQIALALAAPNSNTHSSFHTVYRGCNNYTTIASM